MAGRGEVGVVTHRQQQQQQRHLRQTTKWRKRFLLLGVKLKA